MTQDGPGRHTPSRRRGALLAALGLALGALAVDRGGDRVVAWVHRADPTMPTVALIVMDTVRADHLSLCGYARPTTPTLERLAREGAAWTCDGVAPGSWTLPSHAAYFTGLAPWETRADYTLASGVDLGVPSIPQIGALPLSEAPPVLAEAFAREGRATALVSANPVVGPASGLARGFETVDTASAFTELPGRRVVEVVRATLTEAARSDRPGLFLVVNLADAHIPRAAVPEGIGWVPARPPSVHNPNLGPDDPVRRYVQGRMPATEAAAWTAHLRDTYDWGIHEADAAIAGILEALEETGWTRAGLRLVVTSDHGELLGEHGEVEHGVFLREGTQRVPILVVGGPASLPRGTPVSATLVHDLVATGRLPDALPAPMAVAMPERSWQTWSEGRLGVATQVAAWSGTEKVHAADAAAVRYDLAADPTESAPVPIAAEAVPPAIRAVEARLAEPPPEPAISPALVEALRAAGYVE